jgi:polyketide biosynthesis acyl carrier protein
MKDDSRKDRPVSQDVFTTVRRNVVTVLPDLDPELVTPDRSLTDLGCNSVDRADIVTMSMQDLDLAVPVSAFQQVQSIGGLVALLERYR